jgi:ABC-type transport system substrate-binding protein
MYQDTYYIAQRTDTFVGIEPTVFFPSRNWVTNLRVHKKEGTPLGGTFIWGIEGAFGSSFNPFGYDRYISDMLYDYLVRIGPDGNDVLWMCEDVTILNHADDPLVPEGHTRFLIDIVQNASWSDGTPITAEDFAFSLNFLRDYVLFQGLEDLIACFALSRYRLFCELESESIWDWHKIAYQPLLPMQVWAEYGEDYYQYQPTPETLEEMVVSGPFLPTLWIRGEYEEITQNPNYFRNPRKIMPVTTDSSPTTTTTTSTTYDESRFLIGIVAGILGATVVVLAGGYLIFQYTAPLKVR